MFLTESLKNSGPFIEDILNGMYDWVRVVDKDNNVIYMNKAMSDALGNTFAGKKCHELLGRSGPCENCISRKSIFEGHSHEKEEHINGRIFSVMSSPLRNADGEVIATVEVLRDTTQVKKLCQEMQEQNLKLKNQLEMARKLQFSMLPNFPADPRLDFSLVFMPCESLGGDFLDIFYIDNSHLGLYIADVSGHGVPAALLTVFLRSALNKKLLSPAEALEELYFEFNRSRLDEELYIAVFYAIIDLDKKTMLFSNAGLNVIPVVFSGNRFELLMLPGIPISNWMKKPEYRDGLVNLKSGHKLFMYSDGILELKNKNSEHYSEDKLLDILLNNDLSPEQLLHRIKKSAFEFAGIKSESELPDDITMSLLEIK